MLRRGNSLLIKRIRYGPDGDVMLVSDNSGVRPMRMNSESEWKVIGKVVKRL